MQLYREFIKNLAILTQFGLSLITPLLMCLAVCWWMTSRFGIGGWIFIPGFFFGMGGSGMVGYKLYLSVMSQEKKEKQKRKQTVSFNRHE